jgi:CheY-like chemotaxis protein
MCRVLHLEDSPLDAELIRARCFANIPGLTVVWVDSCERLKFELQTTGFDAIVVDSNVPKCEGYEAIEIARAYAPTVPLIVFSGSMTPGQMQEARVRGAHHVIDKDNLEAFTGCLRDVLRL